MSQSINQAEQKTLLKIAREALEHSVRGQVLTEIKLEELPPALQVNGASFVTLTKNESLCGCIGTLEAYQPLPVDVQEHAVAAALQDPRFPIVQPQECRMIKIEVSILTQKVPLQYKGAQDLIDKIRPGIDGLVLQDGFRKATFLPQVWEKLPDPEEFLSHLCMKMGAPAGLWRKKPLQVYAYQVQEFHE
ncbi:MAG: AmmeMemoRadiSam system protein A [Chloroflexota bacterium]|nr:AmmeMemoRadiSam system protein A [Chloroflexota bacterium]